MPTLKRLRDVEKGMTVKQVVLLHLQEARRHPSMMAHAQSLIGKHIAPEDTLCGRIQAAVLAAAKGKPERTRHLLTRDAQREGLFLSRLAGECNARLAGAEREWTLESVLLLLFRAICLRDERGTASAEALLEMAGEVHARLADHLQAVRLIERKYFDSAGILYEEAEAELITRIQEAEESIEWAQSHVEDRTVESGVGKTPATPLNRNRSSQSPSPNARQLARDIVLSAKIRVHYEFNETSAAERLIDERWGSEPGLDGYRADLCDR